MDNVRDIAGKALLDLTNAGMDEVVAKIITENVFVTRVNLRSLNSGTKSENYIIVDYEREMEFDERKFKRHSLDLYDSLREINKWYDC